MKPVVSGKSFPVYVVGLTGNIATGKSTVMAMLAQRGVFTIDADELAHQLLETDPAVQSAVVARFGPEIQMAAGAIDRSKLGVIVFRDPAKMRDLENIIHPRVAARVDELIAHCKALEHPAPFAGPVVVVEAIKLLESELRPRCQAIWVTTCRPEQQIRRLMDGRQMTRQEAQVRIQSQPPQAEKLAQAEVVIDTSGRLDQTEQQVERAWRKIQHGRAT